VSSDQETITEARVSIAGDLSSSTDARYLQEKVV
jgi:hypothetical protein